MGGEKRRGRGASERRREGRKKEKKRNERLLEEWQKYGSEDGELRG